MIKLKEPKAEDEMFVETVMPEEDHSDRILVGSSCFRPRKRRNRECKIPDLNLEVTYEGEEEMKGDSSGLGEPQDADYVFEFCPELESRVLAHFPCLENWKLRCLNKQYSLLLRSGEIFKIRREIGFSEPSVFMLSEGDTCWRAFDRQFQNCRQLPILPSDYSFLTADRESLCAGTHMLVSGREIDGIVVWRYELETNKWQKGPSMINPRCLFASATCGTCAFVAGGMMLNADGVLEVLDTAEKYSSETKTWVRLPDMCKKREFCSGCYLDNKFYVIGGRDEEKEYLTCGEWYDEANNKWELIPNMVEDTPVSTVQSPPLIAVVNNELYSLEPSSNELRVYVKNTNTWKKLGPAPVRAECHKGWGVAFKSLGNELLVIGMSEDPSASESEPMAVYRCCPSPNVDELKWERVDCRYPISYFIRNCTVMVV